MERVKVTEEKVRPKSTVQDVINNMSEGNPRAMMIVLDFLHEVDDLRYLLFCDSKGIRGTKLYQLWNDCCDRDTGKLKRVLDAYANDHISDEEMTNHIRGDGCRGIPFEAFA